MFRSSAVTGLAAIVIAGCGSTGRSHTEAGSAGGALEINTAMARDMSREIDEFVSDARAISNLNGSRDNMRDHLDWSYNPELRRMGLYGAPDGNLYTLPQPRTEVVWTTQRLTDGTWEDVSGPPQATTPGVSELRVSWEEFEEMFRP
jgi:hypothetical protein